MTTERWAKIGNYQILLKLYLSQNSDKRFSR